MVYYNKIKIQYICVLPIVFLFYYLMIYHPNNWIAWFLLIFSYVLPFLFHEVRRDSLLIVIFFFIITLHHIFAFYNSFIKLTNFAPDAIGFYKDASYLSFSNTMKIDFSAASTMYKNFLAYVLNMFGDSIFLVSELSILIFTLSLVVLLKLSMLLNIKKEIRLILLLFGTLPTVLFFTSLPMREAFQILFLLLSCYYGVLFWSKKNILIYLKFLVSILILSLWHNGLMVIAPVILYIFTLNSLDTTSYKISYGVKIIAGILFFGLLAFSFILLGNSGLSSNAASSLASGDALSYTDEYRLRAHDAGSMYSVVFDSSSAIGLITTTPIVFLNYLFAPFPWQIRNVVDIYAFLEGILRLILIINSIKLIRSSKGLEKKVYIALFSIYIILEFIWSLGTLNWGTAMRHHTVGYALLLILGLKKKNSDFEETK